MKFKLKKPKQSIRTLQKENKELREKIYEFDRANKINMAYIEGVKEALRSVEEITKTKQEPKRF